MLHVNQSVLSCAGGPRISPTSFWPLFARAPTDAQAARMVAEWLHSPTRFCVSKTGDASRGRHCHSALSAGCQCLSFLGDLHTSLAVASSHYDSVGAGG